VLSRKEHLYLKNSVVQIKRQSCVELFPYVVAIEFQS